MRYYIALLYLCDIVLLDVDFVLVLFVSEDATEEILEISLHFSRYTFIDDMSLC